MALPSPSLLMLRCGVHLLAGLALLPACKRDEVTYAVTPRVTEAASAVQQTSPMPMKAGDVPLPPVPTGSDALKWTLPGGWTETRPGGMRYATLTPASGAKADVSVVVLPGPAGGELSNVNRWRGQIGLAPIDDAGLGAARQVITAKAGPVSLFDFTSEGQAQSRMVVGLLSTATSTWFVKLLGDAGPVGAAKPEFMNLLGSLHFDD